MALINNRKNDRTGTQEKGILVGLFLTLLTLTIVRTAWMCDDAYISLRVVDNFINGFGLRWNVSERVQVFTHPLWLLTLIPVVAATGEVYFSTIALSAVCSIAACYVLLARITHSTTLVPLIGTALLFSAAFMDYTTSGLENPLSNLLLALFFWKYFNFRQRPSDILWLSLLASLVAGNRLDLVLILLPSLAFALLRTRHRNGFFWLIVGGAPLIAWELFALIYYGFPFPNTFYAKMQTGIPRTELLDQGVIYLLKLIDTDPMTAFAIAWGFVIVLASKQIRQMPLLTGAVLYIAYIVWVGGDFMSGRLFVAPFFTVLVAVARCRISPNALTRNGVHLVLIGGIAATVALTKLDGAANDNAKAIDRNGIADERRFYWERTALVKMRRDIDWPIVTEARRHPKVDDLGIIVDQNVGFLGYYGARSERHILDRNALGDALLARLPASRESWRIGHFARPVPSGYVETLGTGMNRITNPSLASYYDKIDTIIRGPIFSLERLKVIVLFNSGYYEHLIREYVPLTKAD